MRSVWCLVAVAVAAILIAQPQQSSVIDRAASQLKEVVIISAETPAFQEVTTDYDVGFVNHNVIIMQALNVRTVSDGGIDHCNITLTASPATGGLETATYGGGLLLANLEERTELCT